MASDSSTDWGLYSAYLFLLSSAVVPIYTASFSSLKTPKSTSILIKQSKNKKEDSNSDSDESDESTTEITEVLTSSDAYLFPIFGSIVLFSLFLIFKFVDPTIINLLMNSYFAVVGFMAVSKTSNEVLKKLVGKQRWYQVGGRWKIKLEKSRKREYN